MCEMSVSQVGGELCVKCQCHRWEVSCVSNYESLSLI